MLWCDHVLVPDDALSWAGVCARLAAARNYWLCTTMPSGAPHTAPVWGVVIGDTLHLYSERRTVKARNLAADPRAVVHLESAEDVVIVRGTAEDLGTPAQAGHVVTALAAKYTRPGPAVSPGRRTCFRCGLCHQAAIGDDVAPGRLRDLAAPLDLLSSQAAAADLGGLERPWVIRGVRPGGSGDQPLP